MTLTRRGIQLSLGGLWLLDGLLQWQPFMFTRGFANSVLHPTLSGQPAVLAEVLRVAQTPFSVAPVETNLLAAVIQVLLGVGLLRGRHPRAYLLASMLWGVGVW
ncbi:MAG: hypothetical protein HKL87_03335, partial [Acidimicrobiaceae bacterium]|nr:hypothetical protein [Acidimicrobiaceae bacterium]